MESQTYEKVCEFEMIPTYQIFYNEESMFGIYAFCTKDQIPQFSPYNDNKFDDSGDKEYVASKLVGEVQQLYIGTKYNVKRHVFILKNITNINISRFRLLQMFQKHRPIS